MSITLITARTLLTESGQIDYPRLQVEDGILLTVEAGPPNDSRDTLTAAFLDIHVHGAVTHDFMTASAAEIDTVARFLATRGVAYFLPTTVTGPIDLTLRALSTLADSIERAALGHNATSQAAPVGIHLEGPFVSHRKRGVHPAASILHPDIALFDRFMEAARGHIRLLTLAPELPNAIALIQHATAAGVRVSLGHSNATAAEAIAGIAAGATSATHTFNAMRALDHREPGIAGAVLDDQSIYAELICDAIHVDPAFIRLWLKMKGNNHAILVTDGMSATGMPDGTYTLGDFPVEVQNGRCLSNGTLAGSTLTMDRAVSNLQRFTEASLHTAVQLASGNPARMLGLQHLGQITPGSPANFNIYDEAGQLTGTILRGQRIEPLPHALQ